MIEIDDLHKSYRTAGGRVSEVLKGLSLRVPTGSITAVVGPSGAGKSTLARCISLLERPDSGSIRVNGNDLSLLRGEALRRERRAIGTVFPVLGAAEPQNGLAKYRSAAGVPRGSGAGCQSPGGRTAGERRPER
ncbi:ABC transporter [Raoultella terrigena]|uniref:ABC transporter n=1 Tax=Raoultella terrigena TaxID=577 RepID=A0A7Z8Z878_RAOTE|nr:ABC transporter [Raoultella terrigena]